MKTNILLLLFITLKVIVFAEVDSILAASPPLSGEIHTRNENYEPEVFFLGMGAGDTGIPMIPPYIANATERAYLTFPLDSLDLTTEIDSVQLRLWAYQMSGNDNNDVWPIWNIPDGDTIKLCIDHIDFGDELDDGDWTAGDLDDTQTISSKFTFIYQENYDPEIWFINVNVTNAVLSDITNERNKTQLRIRFEVDSDMDGLYDYIHFEFFSPYPPYSDHYPTLLFFSQDSTLIEKQEVISTNNISLENYPNPFITVTSIRFSLPSNLDNQSIEIFNVKGKKIKSFNCRNQTPIIWDGKDEFQNQVSSGVYFYQIKAGDHVLKTNKMLLIK